ncbi:MAG: hypothetical protein ABL999_07025 [Pyrinomonadaceae bacterium]
MEEQGDNLRLYLLGALTERNAQVIDVRIIEDESFAADLLLAESDLMEAYLAGELSAADENLFHSNFLISPGRKELLRETSLFENYASRRNLETIHADVTKIESPETGFFENYFNSLIFGGALITAVILIGLFIWPGILNTKPSPLEREYAELNRQDFTEMIGLKDSATFNLVSVNTRDFGSAVTKSSSVLADLVFFRLALLPGESEGSNFSVDLLRGSSLVFSVASVRSYQNEAGREVRFVLPKSVLTKGQYRIRLSSPDARSPASNYAFVVE